jgi:S1-C subfamily serine protease
MAGYEPPVGPHTTTWPYPGGYWAPPSPPPRRGGGVGVFIGLVLVLLLMCVGGAAGFAAWRTTAGSDEPLLSRGVVPSKPPTTGRTGGTSADATGIATAIDPSVVDIVTTLGLQQASAAGTGIVLTPSGEVLTNNHVINGATSISVTDVGNGQTYQADVVGYDRTRDLAVIQLQNASGLATAPIGDSSTVSVGDSVVAIGNAGGRGGTPAVVTGSVTGLDQTITASDEDGSDAQQLSGLIRVAADIQPGDSGGPLVDAKARIVGIDTAATSSYRFQSGTGEGFAIPINQAIAVAREIELGQAPATVHIGATAFLGVAVSAGRQGVIITQVVPGSPAEQAGLTRGDEIVSMDGTAVDSPTKLTSLLTPHHPGDRVRVSALDQTGQPTTVTVTLAAGPAA